MIGLVSLKKRHQSLSPFPCPCTKERPCEDAARRRPSASHDENSPETKLASALTDLGLLSSRTVRNDLLLKPPRSVVSCDGSPNRLRQALSIFPFYRRGNCSRGKLSGFLKVTPFAFDFDLFTSQNGNRSGAINSVVKRGQANNRNKGRWPSAEGGRLGRADPF